MKFVNLLHRAWFVLFEIQLWDLSSALEALRTDSFLKEHHLGSVDFGIEPRHAALPTEPLSIHTVFLVLRNRCATISHVMPHFDTASGRETKFLVARGEIILLVRRLGHVTGQHVRRYLPRLLFLGLSHFFGTGVGEGHSV